MVHPILLELIRTSPLADFEREILSSVFGTLDATLQETLAKLCSDQQWLIPYLYINYAQKRYALESGDADLVRSVVERQLKPLEDLVE